MKSSIFLLCCFYFANTQLAAQPLPAVFEPAYRLWSEELDIQETWALAKAIKPSNEVEKQWLSAFEVYYLAGQHRWDEAIKLASNCLKTAQANSLLAAELSAALLESQLLQKPDPQLWQGWDALVLAFRAQQQPERESQMRYNQAYFLFASDNKQVLNAEDMLIKSQTWLKENLSPKQKAWHLFHINMGQFYFEAGKFSKMAAVLEAGYTALQQHRPDDTELRATYCSSLGWAYNEQNDVDKGETFYQAALLEYEKLGNPYQIANARYNVARVLFFERRPWEEIRPLMQKVAATFDTLPWDPQRQALEGIYEHLLLAEFYINDQQLDKMLNFYQTHQDDIIKYDLDAQNVYRLMSDIHHYKGEKKEAIASIKKKLEYNRQRYGEQHSNTITSYFELTRMEFSHGDAEQALAYADIGIAASTANSDNGESGGSSICMDCLFLNEFYYARALALTKLQRWQEAQQQWVLAMRAVELQRSNLHQQKSQQLNTMFQRSFSAGVIKSSWKLYEQSQDRDYWRQMLEYSEQTRSASLHDYLTKYRSDGDALGIPDSLLKRQEWHLHQIDSLKDQINRNKQSKEVSALQQNIIKEQSQLKQLNDKMQRDYADARLWSLGQRVSFEEIQAHLDDETAYISYFPLANETFIFHLTKTDFKVRSIPMAFDSMPKRVAALRQMMSRPDPSVSAQQYGELAYQFYMDFVYDSLIINKKKWIILPEASLYAIPFEALVCEQPKQVESYNQLVYLIKKHTIRYEHSSALMLRRRNTPQATAGSLLALAPSYTPNNQTFKDLPLPMQLQRSKKEWTLRQSLSALSGNEREIRAIEQLFPTGKYLSGLDANETAFKSQAAGYPIIHLAMHGLPDMEDPMYGALAMTENSDSLEDNFLYTYEIYGLDLRQTQMVVLSACQTAEGQFAYGEGIQSVGRAFLYAGAASLVSTQWELNDEASVRVMESFYKNLKEGMPKDEALQRAKLDYLEQNKSLAGHPFFWASFVLIGDPTPIEIQTASGFSAWWLWTSLAVVLGIIGWYFVSRSKARQR